ncbi:MAG: hypothetical protein AB4426_15305 [Xenococcaceae cyanobacterium]
MFTIDLTLKNTPMTLSVQRKETEDAEAVYQKIIEAMRSPSPKLLELTCEKQPDKKVAVFSDQISAVIVSQKSGATALGRVPGFIATAEAE